MKQKRKSLSTRGHRNNCWNEQNSRGPHLALIKFRNFNPRLRLLREMFQRDGINSVAVSEVFTVRPYAPRRADRDYDVEFQLGVACANYPRPGHLVFNLRYLFLLLANSSAL